MMKQMTGMMGLPGARRKATKSPKNKRKGTKGGPTRPRAGGGLPAGFAIAVAEDDPDRMLYAARNRLFVSRNGGVFWHALPFELPDIEGVGWLD
jgi:hypothetical protein